ncbi:unnamed protein product [Moneuplotes crassus]|uniref:Uncharacterized protein n=1 Tax=Euplotes crassus TaxID=5936 RepID=A0AAD2D1L3_EUPCR|nr:unnamed protein product [Moneuplotes crassus]
MESGKTKKNMSKELWAKEKQLIHLSKSFCSKLAYIPRQTECVVYQMSHNPIDCITLKCENTKSIKKVLKPRLTSDFVPTYIYKIENQKTENRLVKSNPFSSRKIRSISITCPSDKIYTLSKDFYKLLIQNLPKVGVFLYLSHIKLSQKAKLNLFSNLSTTYELTLSSCYLPMIQPPRSIRTTPSLHCLVLSSCIPHSYSPIQSLTPTSSSAAIPDAYEEVKSLLVFMAETSLAKTVERIDFKESFTEEQVEQMQEDVQMGHIVFYGVSRGSDNHYLLGKSF